MTTASRTATRPGAGTAGSPQPKFWIAGWTAGRRLPPDRQQAERHLHWLDKNATRFAFRLIHDWNREQNPTRLLYGSLAQHWDELARLNELGFGVFYQLNESDGHGQKGTNIVRVRTAFVDLDGQPLPDPDHHGAHAIIWTSGPRGGQEARAHLLWHADVPLADFRLLQLGLADEFSGDDTVHDLPRVARLAGTNHQKGSGEPGSPFRCVPWWLDHDAPTLTLHDFRSMFPAVEARFQAAAIATREREHQQQVRAHLPPATANEFIGAWRAWFTREAALISPGGEGRHQLLKRAARHLLDNGLQERDAAHELTLMLPNLPARATGPVPDSEAREAVRWTYQNLQPGNPWKLAKRPTTANGSHDGTGANAPQWKPRTPGFTRQGAFGIKRTPWDGRR